MQIYSDVLKILRRYDQFLMKIRVVPEKVKVSNDLMSHHLDDTFEVCASDDS